MDWNDQGRYLPARHYTRTGIGVQYSTCLRARDVREKNGLVQRRVAAETIKMNESST